MDTSDVQESDVLELNVGGSLMSTTRETLTQNLIILRCKLIEDPDHPAMPPAVQPDSQAEFAALVRFFGLQDFMQSCAAGSNADFLFDKVLFMRLEEDLSVVTAIDEHGYALAQPSMPNGQHYIKCCIEKIGQNPWMFLGVTRQLQLQAQEGIENFVTSFGWTPFGQHAASEYIPSIRPMQMAGSIRQPYWGEGHTLIFNIVVQGEQGSLSMGCVHSGRVFELEMDFCATSHRPLVFAVGAAPGTSIRIAAASWEDWSQFANRCVV